MVENEPNSPEIDLDDRIQAFSVRKGIGKTASSFISELDIE